MKRFFETLYMSLRRGARAVLQIYPENHKQAEMLVAAAMKVCVCVGGCRYQPKLNRTQCIRA